MDSTYALVTGVLIFCVYKLYKGYDPAVRAILDLSSIYRYLTEDSSQVARCHPYYRMVHARPVVSKCY